MTDIDKRKRRRMLLISILILTFIIKAFWNQPVYKKYTIESNKIQNSITIVQISDLHSSIYGKNQAKLIKMVEDVNPDIIALTGDIVDDVESEDGAYLLIEGLVDKYPMYYVSGNHEVWHKESSVVFEELDKRGVIILNNTYEEICIRDEKIILAGIMEANVQRRSISEEDITKQIEVLGIKDSELTKEQDFTILLAHRPEFHELYKELPIDLALSGHAHGGQVRIPYILNGLYAPDQGFFPHYAGGIYDFQKYKMIVSRGLSFNLRLPRIFNPPEIVVITVIGGKNES
jgi:predicted MPP superfamily phosphohydrolase